MPWAACTFAAKARLPSARVVARSFAEHHPGVPFFVPLADEVEGCFDPAAEPYELLGLDALDLPDLRARCFRYEREQLSYALTPTLLRCVLDRGFERVLFLKQESLVCGSLDEAVARLDDTAVLLTPHLLEPLAPERELTILQSGVYNLGFLAVADRPPARAFLGWWEDRLGTECRHAVEEGLHWEQRWADLAPSLFPDVGVLRDERVNVGHWNLPERSVEDVRLLPVQRLRARRAGPGDTLRRPADDGCAQRRVGVLRALPRGCCSTPAGRSRWRGRMRSRASPTAARSRRWCGASTTSSAASASATRSRSGRVRSRRGCASRSTRAGPP